MSKAHEWCVGEDGRSFFCPVHKGKGKRGRRPYHFRMFHQMRRSEMESMLGAVKEAQGDAPALNLARAIAKWTKTPEGRRWQASRNATR